MPQENLQVYLSGENLYGDDFALSQIQAWYEDEKEGYADLGARDAENYRYVYHALNIRHGFRHLPHRRFDSALGFGSAYGNEFEPIADRIAHLTIVDPSDAFVREIIHGIPATYVKPQLSGTLPFGNDAFDLVTCLGVLHHIPNVSYVLGELYRCLKPGGYALIREPITSMGDWSKPRRGLTKRERGIPDHLMKSMIAQLGFNTLSRSYCMFPAVPGLYNVFGASAYNSRLATRLDEWLAWGMKWNLTYHARSVLKKFRPGAVFQVLTK
jgi:SAM-dependent methyltransferase